MNLKDIMETFSLLYSGPFLLFLQFVFFCGKQIIKLDST